MAIINDIPKIRADEVTPCIEIAGDPQSTKHRSSFRKRFVDPFVSADNPPWFDAWGVAVGLFVGLGIPLGAQMLLLGLSRLAFRFNAALAFACTCVNNPLSVIPMYYGYYCLGSRILDKPVALNASAFRAMLRPVIQADYFWESVHSFMYLGRDILMRWSIGAIVSASVVALVGGVVCYNIQRVRYGRNKANRATTSVARDARTDYRSSSGSSSEGR